jgi:hypothetical protein
VSQADTRALIEGAVQRFQEDVPALKPLKLVFRLELHARGEAPVWRVELPGPQVSKDPGGDARVDVSIPRVFFNELARDGRLPDWVEAYEHGHVRVSGDRQIIRLVGNVVERQLARQRAR